MNSRIQDFVLVISGLQKIARCGTKLKQSEIRNILNEYPSVKELKLQSSVNTLQNLSGSDLAKKSALVLENSILFSQALSSVVIRDILKGGAESLAQTQEKYTFVEYPDVEESDEKLEGKKKYGSLFSMTLRFSALFQSILRQF